MRPVTLFTGQWADLPIETLCQQAVEFGYDGLELACWETTLRLTKPQMTMRGQARTARKTRSSAVFHFQSPRRPSRVRRHRQPPPSHPASAHLRRRGPGGACASAQPKK